MSKRQAGVQINKDQYDADAPLDTEPTGTWQKADDSVLAARKIRKAKRPPARGGQPGLPGAPSQPRQSPARASASAAGKARIGIRAGHGAQEFMKVQYEY